MRMVNHFERKLAIVDLAHHRQMLFRIHQERSARIARKRVGVVCVLVVLDIRDRTDLISRLITKWADNESAAFVGELALRLRNDRVHVRARYFWSDQACSL